MADQLSEALKLVAIIAGSVIAAKFLYLAWLSIRFDSQEWVRSRHQRSSMIRFAKLLREADPCRANSPTHPED